ncbi:MAG TPA: HAD family hydrolase [Polyangiaceae bacterium]|nr:HAD family hydrolase [Polyangiaceae bacterium]
MPRCSLLITDLDNTVWDWFAVWHASFSALISETSRISGVSVAQLEAEAKKVHERHRTTEYALLLEELPSLQALHPNGDIAKIYDEAIHAHRSARKSTIRLYDGVRETLERVHTAGVQVIGYTESMAFYTSDRMRKTGLDDVLDYLYSAPDHDFPEGVTPEALRTYPPSHYDLRRTEHRHTPLGATKPDPVLLRKIVTDAGVPVDQVVYVGDSLMKDVAMGKAAGVHAVWAKYGVAHKNEAYELLRRVTHWTLADVEREKQTTHEAVEPAYVIQSFAELLDLFEFEAAAGATATA